MNAIAFVHLVHVRSAVVSPIRRHLAKTVRSMCLLINVRTIGTRTVIVTLLPFTLLESHSARWLPSSDSNKTLLFQIAQRLKRIVKEPFLASVWRAKSPSSVYILVAGRERYGKHRITPHIAEALSGP